MSRLATLAIAAAAFGCGRRERGSQGAPPAGSDPWAATGSAGSASPPAPAPVITVLAPGAEPRRVLAYAPSHGDRHAPLTFTIGSADPDAPPEATQRITLQLGWHSPSALGQPWTFEVEQARAAPAPGASPNEQAVIDTIWKGFETVRGDVRAPSSQDLTPETHSLLATQPSLATLLSMVLVPLPATPVGAGARWRVQQATPADDARPIAVATYELTDLAPDHVTVTVAGRGSAGTAQGDDADETETGAITVQLADLLPTAADVTLRVALHVTAVPRHGDPTMALHVRLGP